MILQKYKNLNENVTHPLCHACGRETSICSVDSEKYYQKTVGLFPHYEIKGHTEKLLFVCLHCVPHDRI